MGRVGLLACTVLLAAGAAVLLRREIEDPGVRLLLPEGSSSWIRLPEPFSHVGRPAANATTLFRRRFTLDRAVLHPRCVVRALQSVAVQIDGASVGPPPLPTDRWKDPIEVELGPRLPAGEHLILLAVRNRTGPPCLLARATEIGLATDSSWEASGDGGTWTRAMSVETPENLTLWDTIPSVRQAFSSLSAWIAALFLAGFAWTIARSRGLLGPFRITPSRVRWILLAAWVVLAANNLPKIPLAQGFDVSAHVDYVRYVAERGRLPLANEGWEMYQAPLYYVVTAAWARLLEFAGVSTIEPLLRAIPLACGAAQVEIAYRTMRHAFPDRDDLQCIGTWIAGLLPVNLYISQVVGNEPFAGLACSVVALLCVRSVSQPGEARPMSEAIGLGVALGIALLSKMTAVLWIPLAGIALARGRIVRAAVALGTAALLSGWFYARNWIELGKPFVGNWDWKETNRIWWQDPGYRIPEHFLRFGQSLVQPVYAAVRGFWDSMYSTLWADGLFGGTMIPPPWNLDWMLAGAWLGLPITIAVAAGMLGAAPRGRSAGRAEAFSSIAVLLFLFAAVAFYLRLPIYSCAKASYLLPILPCLALLAAAGLRPAVAKLVPRAIVNGLLIASGAAAYAAYFVRSA